MWYPELFAYFVVKLCLDNHNGPGAGLGYWNIHQFVANPFFRIWNIAKLLYAHLQISYLDHLPSVLLYFKQ